MIEIQGKYGSARVFADALEPTAAEQLRTLCDQRFVEGCRLRIMPDVHAGAGCVIGFTADLGELVIPNIVGVDIGCGMLTVELGKHPIDYDALDALIRAKIPSGRGVHEGRELRFDELQALHCYRSLRDTRRIERSLGTLGGGNHFIEIDSDGEGGRLLVIHSGSRNLGKQVAEQYQALACDLLHGREPLFRARDELIARYKAEGRRGEIQDALKQLYAAFKESECEVPRELCYLHGDYRRMYLDDMAICQRFAALNRRRMAEVIVEGLLGRSLDELAHFETVHNYIDLESNIVRKGAVSARAGERLLIPINMRDGSLICVGKGNPDWNESAPHGAGRLFSRTEARERFTAQEFRDAMTGIYTTSAGEETLDECPMAYKSMDAIVSQIGPTAEIERIIRPEYNFKAEE